MTGLRCCLLLLSTFLAACGSPPSADIASDRPPNFVVVFADDLGWGDLGSYGAPVIRTPNLDRMAAEGQRWTNFYVTASVCSPSRAGLLTGRLPVRNGLYGDRARVLFPDFVGGIQDEEVTIAEALSDLGYATGMFGKWHLGDRPQYLPTRHGFDYWFGIPYSNDMMSTWEPGERRAAFVDPKIEYWDVPLIRSERDEAGEVVTETLEQPADQTTITKRYAEEAVDFIRAHRDEPFFVYLPHSMPHVPLFRSPAFEDHSGAGLYGDVIEEIDWSVGRILETLEEEGIAENTVVFFSSDNGPWTAFRTQGGSAGPLREMPFYRGSELYAYRVGNYKAHFITQGAYGLAGERTEQDPPLLYDLALDPGEQWDIAAEQPEVLADVTSRALQHRAGVVLAPSEFDLRTGGD